MVKGLLCFVDLVSAGMNIAVDILEEQAMLDRRLLKETINILMQSASYFYLTIQERLRIIKDLMKLMA